MLDCSASSRHGGPLVYHLCLYLCVTITSISFFHIKQWRKVQPWITCLKPVGFFVCLFVFSYDGFFSFPFFFFLNLLHFGLENKNVWYLFLWNIIKPGIFLTYFCFSENVGFILTATLSCLFFSLHSLTRCVNTPLIFPSVIPTGKLTPSSLSLVKVVKYQWRFQNLHMIRSFTDLIFFNGFPDLLE